MMNTTGVLVMPGRAMRTVTVERDLHLRDARPEDLGLLIALLLEAVNWNPDRRPIAPEELNATPQLQRYIEGWSRPGDHGVVALIGDERGHAAGAAWIRRFTAGYPGFGFVNEQTPEMTLAVSPGYRRRGIGRALCLALLDRAQNSGLGQVSLSVERVNPAIALYRSLGFVEYADGGEAVTMLWRP
jgi:ribosomal protein S18 acetylase RimI-like enzyme